MWELQVTKSTFYTKNTGQLKVFRVKFGLCNLGFPYTFSDSPGSTEYRYVFGFLRTNGPLPCQRFKSAVILFSSACNFFIILQSIFIFPTNAVFCPDYVICIASFPGSGVRTPEYFRKCVLWPSTDSSCHRMVKVKSALKRCSKVWLISGIIPSAHAAPTQQQTFYARPSFPLPR